jgi:proteic killer suppression protein
VKIRNFAHKGLKRLYEHDDPRSLPAETVDKLRKMLAFLENMENVDELRRLAAWRAHVLSGVRKGTWSLFVTRNWRLTFRVDSVEDEVFDINFEDYH